MTQKKIIEASSFRDPSGFVFYSGTKVFRQVNQSYQENYLLFKSSGLSQLLVKNRLLLEFTEVTAKKTNPQLYKLLATEKLPFISYPYEWSFSQLKDAALLTLKIQKMALEHQMSLKDGSAYNVQFFKGKPIFIDLLSFEKYEEGTPWVAYQQFCQHFLAPLLLMSKVDLSLQQVLKNNLDGISLNLVSKLLPKSTFLNFAILSHIHLHAWNQHKHSQDASAKPSTSAHLTKPMLLAVIENLRTCIGGLSLREKNTEWVEYYTFTNYSQKAFANKTKIIKKYIALVKPRSVWDLGGNTGEFSRLASEQGIPTISFDIDPLAVEKNYKQVKKNKEEKILPLLMDFMNQSPNLGWALQERKSLLERGPVDMVMALALVHHLCISHNVPFEFLASYISQLCTHLIIEFVPKEDSKVQILLATRKDIFPWYNQPEFEKAFLKFFHIVKKEQVGGNSLRTIYLLKKI